MRKFFRIFHSAGHERSWATAVAVSTVFGCAAGAVGTLLIIAFVAPSLTAEYPVAQTRLIGAVEPGVSATGVESAVRALAFLAPSRASAVSAATGYVPAEAFGVGMALTSDGWIVTHESAVAAKGKRDMVVVVDGRAHAVARMVRDPYTGAVFAKVDATDLAVVPFGDTSALAPGDAVFVLDPAGGIAQMTVAALDARPAGALGDAVRSSDAVQRMVRLAGPKAFPGAIVLDRRGDVVAIVAEQSSLGTLAVPMESVASAVGAVLRGGDAARPSLGVGFVDLTRVAGTGEGPRRGAHVASVMPGGAAAAAGVRVGDIVLSINGEPVSAKKGLSELVADYAPGDKLSLVVQRGSATEVSLVATLGTAPATR